MRLLEATTHSDPLLRAMFVARKEVFIDLLKWDLPALDGRYEIDQFDGPSARYLIVADARGNHRASARLLPTTEPHILDSLFSDLSEGPVPTGPDCFEITRFCLDRHQSARERRDARNRLVSGLARFALDEGIASYTGVAELGWFQQVLAFGWQCRALGLPQAYGSATLTALQIDIDAQTPALLRNAGIHNFDDDDVDLTLKVAA